MKFLNTPSVAAVCLLAILFTPIIADSPIIRMARISVIEGPVSYRRAADDQNAWFDASANTPVGENDQVFVGKAGRAELQLSGRNIVRLDSETSFRISKFTTAITQLALPVGTAIFRIDSLDRTQFDIVDARDTNQDDPLYFEVNTPSVSVTLTRTGLYRITVQEDGSTEVIVRSGEAEVYNEDLRTITLSKGKRIQVDGRDPASYKLARLEDRDSFDHWSERLDDQLAAQAQAVSSRYVPHGVAGLYDLDRYGDWQYTSDYGYVWAPRSIAVGWAPYRVGYWNWYSDWGWTWISNEPWGWAPYHYGRWAYYRDRWCWVPRGGLSIGFSWSPALVSFFGWGNGYDRGYVDGYRQGYVNGRYNYVGWVPLAPGEHYYNPFRGGNRTVDSAIDRYRNYNVPGGITRMDGRRFDSHRISVANNFSPVDQGVIRSAVTVRGDSFRPVGGSPEPARGNPQTNAAYWTTAQKQVISRDSIRGRDMGTTAPRSRVNDNVPTFRNSDVVRPADRSYRPEPSDRGRTNTTDQGRDSMNPGRTGTIQSNPGRQEERRTADRPRGPQGSGETNRGTEMRRDTNPADNSIRRDTSPRRVETPPARPDSQPGPGREMRREERPTPGRDIRPVERSYSQPQQNSEAPQRQIERRSEPARVESRPAPAREVRPIERSYSPPPQRYEAPRQVERRSEPARSESRSQGSPSRSEAPRGRRN